MGRKTRLDIQNYGCNGNLHCDHGVVETYRISSLQSHGKALGKDYYHYYYHYFYTPCSIDDQGKKLEAKNKYHIGG